MSIRISNILNRDVFIEREGVRIHNNDIIEKGDVLDVSANTVMFGHRVYTLTSYDDNNNIINKIDSFMDVEDGSSIAKTEEVLLDIGHVDLSTPYCKKSAIDRTSLISQRELEAINGLKFEFNDKIYIGVEGGRKDDVVYQGSGPFEDQSITLSCNRAQFHLGRSPIRVEQDIRLREQTWKVDSISKGRVTFVFRLIKSSSRRK